MIANDPQIKSVRKELNEAMAEAVKANSMLRNFNDAMDITEDTLSGPPQVYIDHVASLWAVVEELEATISHLKSNLESKVP